ncbi:MAG: Lrp/AsnC family transcriptional regulator [Pseudomonadota bacterium]
MTKIDDINRRILRTLESDGRISNADLAAQVGLSPSACLRRVQELEKAGVIKGYRAVVDRTALEGGLTVYVAVGLSEHSKDAQRAFERAMGPSAEVRELHNVTGVVEYLLRVEARDIEAYKAFHTDVLGAAPHVSAITSYVVMGSPKDERG